MTDQKGKYLKGLIILGILWIISSLGHMVTLSSYSWYKYSLTGHDLPANMIPIRYMISWAQRFLGLAVGIGLIDHRRWAAKTAIILSVFDILTEYWRYPYEAFKNQSVVFDEKIGGTFAKYGIHFSDYVPQAVIATYCIDALFFSFVLYYLSRPWVKEKLV